MPYEQLPLTKLIYQFNTWLLKETLLGFLDTVPLLLAPSTLTYELKVSNSLMKDSSRLILVAISLLFVVVGSIIVYLGVQNSAETSVHDRWWGVPSIILATLSLFGWLVLNDKDEFL